MKIFRSIRSLYRELKRFNDNVERLTAFNEKKAREKENPLADMTDTEVSGFRYWVCTQIAVKNIDLQIAVRDGYARGQIEKFLGSRTARYPGAVTGRESLAAVLGYRSFADLVEAWRKAGGAA
jgi:hypothetical protein